MAKRTVRRTDEHAVQMAAKCGQLLEKLTSYYNTMNTARNTEITDMTSELTYTYIYDASGDYADKYSAYWQEWYQKYQTCDENANTTLTNLATRIEELKTIKSDWESKMYYYEEVDE